MADSEAITNKLPNKEKLSLENAIFFFDIDDTLIDTAVLHENGVQGIVEVITKHTGSSEKGQQFGKKVDDIFKLMLAGYQVKDEAGWQKVPGGKEAYENLLRQVESYQLKIKEEWGAIKKWSREVFIKLAGDELGIKIIPELVEEVANAYWQRISEKMEPFPHAKALFDQLHDMGRPVYLITSSDARLKLVGDQFEYDPEYSELKKRERMEILKEKGLDFRLIVVGDPEDKPSVEFFEKGIKAAEKDLKVPIHRSRLVIIGDSYRADVKIPITQLGFGLGVVFAKGSEFRRESDKLVIVGQLTDISRAFE